MRWLVVLILLAAGAGLGAVGLLLLREESPEDLLPDLVAPVPRNLEIVQVGDTYRLAFASAVANRGRGPLVLKGERPDRAGEAMSVRQVVRSSDGSERRRPVEAEIRFEGDGAEGRWLVLGLVGYELLDAEDGDPARPAEEAGLCLGDRRRIAPTDGPGGALWTEDCGLGQPGLLSLSQGVSPGWRSVDEAERLSMDVTSVPAGRYVLVHRVDPSRSVEEADRGNNASSLLLRLQRSAGEIPSVRVLARCPGSDRCSGGER